MDSLNNNHSHNNKLNTDLIELSDEEECLNGDNNMNRITYNPKQGEPKDPDESDESEESEELDGTYLESDSESESSDSDPENYSSEELKELKDSDKEDVITKEEIILIHKDNIVADDKKVMNFIRFCIKKGLFDDTFYDYGNAFSVVATKLPVTFDQMSKDGENIEMDDFISTFKNKFKYRGDVKYIYGQIDTDNKQHITWDEFTKFFLPFVKYVTI